MKKNIKRSQLEELKKPKMMIQEKLKCAALWLQCTKWQFEVVVC